MTLIDVIIIGGGPAGIATAATLQAGGLRPVIFEKGALADAIARWPYYLTFFSTAPNVELAGFPLVITGEKPTRQEYLAYLRRLVTDRALDVRTYHEVTDVRREEGAGGGEASFVVTGHNLHGEPFTQRARYVVLATGAFDFVRPLNVPGEDLPHVTHYFTEVHPYAGHQVTVVGGGTSAVETALLLWRAGAEVTVVCRAQEFCGLKYWQDPDMKNRIEKGEIRAFFGAELQAIEPHAVVLEVDGKTERVPTDFVLAMTGYQPDVSLLKRMGVDVDEANKRPHFNPETLETNVPGLYVAGVVTSGNVGGQVFIENAREHGEIILRAIRDKV
ncbi:hypothetical protein CVU37_15020 [candidate division BRC1 bacterium HGW-BRC1-1]|jgi:thioredoxin reductase (NADPH)|nr:MAG: hypothetical protein CVU37_15020 [candidate division BRC1 bacterium HGW-BRC1-1]